MCVIDLPKLLPFPSTLICFCTHAVRKKSIIDKVSALGLSISYNRVDEIQSSITDQTKRLVHPFGLADSLLTTAAIDNVDHNASSSISKNHFHGTSISLFQHLDWLVANYQIVFDLSNKVLGAQKDFKLPSYYTKFTPVGAVKIHYPIKAINSGVAKLQAHPVKMCNKWLKFVDDVNYGSLKETVTRISKWAAYHQESSEQMPSVPITSILLPLMNESINSPATELLSIIWWLCRELSRTLIPVKSR